MLLVRSVRHSVRDWDGIGQMEGNMEAIEAQGGHHYRLTGLGRLSNGNTKKRPICKEAKETNILKLQVEAINQQFSMTLIRGEKLT